MKVIIRLITEVQLSSVAQSCPTLATPWTAAHQASLSIINSWSLLELMSIESSPSPPAFNLSQHQGLFKYVSSAHQVAKVWSFSFSISPFNEYLGLISFRTDWFDLLAVQRTLKSSPTPHFKSMNSSALSFLTLTSTHDY